MILVARPSPSQSILTYAGGGVIGDGRPATAATLKEPNDVAVDAAGNLYINDSKNHRIRRVDSTTGVITTIAGGGSNGPRDGGPATEAEIANSFSLVVDGSGNIFFSDTNRIRRVDGKTGIVTVVAGGGSSDADGVAALDARLGGITGIALDAAGNLYMADFGSRVRKLSGGIITTVAGTVTAGFSGDGGPATAAQLNAPADVAVDGENNIYIVERQNARVRRVDGKTGIITTFAGTGQQQGVFQDGVPATSVNLFVPSGIATDASGNVYITNCCAGIYRVDKTSGLIFRVAGAGPVGFSGDGGPARSALLDFPNGIALSATKLFIADAGNNRARSVDLATGIITTAAGGGSIGDGGPAISSQLFQPLGVVTDAAGNLFIADRNAYRIRKIDRSTGTISTIAGTGLPGRPVDGTATQIPIVPYGVAIHPNGDLCFSEGFGGIRCLNFATGKVTTVAGRLAPGQQAFAGDGGPAVDAILNQPRGIDIDKAGNIFIADSGNNRIRRVDAATKTINTVAGSGPINDSTGNHGGFAGDGGPATQALLGTPTDVAYDDLTGAFYIADLFNNRIRGVGPDGTITTIAGGGIAFSEGSPATDSRLDSPTSVALDSTKHLLYATEANGFYAGRVRKIDLDRGTITTVAGLVPGLSGFSGDGGPATAAYLSQPSGIALDSKGNLFISDTNNNRIRSVFACVSVGAPSLIVPDNGATAQSVAPTLSWQKVDGAFRYDVFLDSRNPPGRFAAQDLETTSLTLANLLPATTYFWKVNAKGDPFCPTPSIGPSEIRSFTTTGGGCQAPGNFSQLAPNDGEAGVSATPALSWSASSGAASYDVYLGAANPPPLIASTTATSYQSSTLSAGTKYFWQIVAHASCDATQTTRTLVRSFTVGGGCAAAGPFSQIAPSPGATNVPTATTLQWGASANASGYDLYLGTTNPPPIYLPDLPSTSLDISGLFAGKTYFWRVVAKVACDASKNVSTGIAPFTTGGDCAVPGPTAIIFTPPGNIGVGQTYAIAWSLARGLDANGGYLVERSLSPSFSPLVDSQLVMTSSASFIATTPGAYYHRVKAVAGCDPSKTGPYSDPKIVTVVSGTPNIIFTVQPRTVITNLGEKLEDKKSTFTLENISTSTVQLILGKAEISSAPFFTVIDPFGGDAVFVTLEPRKPKVFELKFSGPANDQPGSYQGIVFASAPGAPIIPYAFVNLKVGSGGSATPRFTAGGATSEYAFFPGLSGDDSSRAPITVTIQNPGSTPMELGAEIGPEVWLVPEAGWNTTAIPPGSSRDVRLFTKRNRAPNGSALPRYTYFTVRTRSGESARLLVQDNDAPPLSSGRGAGLDPAVRSFIVPDVVSAASSATGATLVTRLRLSNVGSDVVQLTLFFTPKDADGFDAGAVKTAVIVAPPNDVVTLTDPLVQLFGLTRPAAGQIEVRAAPEKLGLVTVSSGIVSIADPERTLVALPTLWRGEGARSGAPHRLPGMTSTPVETSGVVLVETSGVDAAKVRLDLYDKEGTIKGTTRVDVPRYGHKQIDDIAATTGAGTIDGGKIRLTVESGGGSVTAIGKIRGRTTESAASFVSQADGETGSGAKAYARVQAAVSWNDASGMLASVIPFVPSGPAATNLTISYSTLLGLGASPAISASFVMTFTDSAGKNVTKSVSVPAGKTVEYKDVVKDLFAIAEATQGTLLVQASPGGQVYSRVFSMVGLVTTVNGALPVVPTTSQGLTSLLSGGQRPLYLDGLEQSTDPTRGATWSLYLNEVRGQSGQVTVRLFEAGNRSTPIAETTIALSPLGQVRLEPLFNAMGLANDERLKDRTNMLLMVTPQSGSALVAATGVATDNRTGERKTYSLAPASGLPASGELAAAVTPPPRRHGARHP
ncbi:MAG TPA: hypothetical protein VHL58_15930 [Thermoanaerobaculia bacterium]|nr:hypothetical protein [Thermoanaerobaculia bacterium]